MAERDRVGPDRGARARTRRAGVVAAPATILRKSSASTCCEQVNVQSRAPGRARRSAQRLMSLYARAPRPTSLRCLTSAGGSMISRSKVSSLSRRKRPTSAATNAAPSGGRRFSVQCRSAAAIAAPELSTATTRAAPPAPACTAKPPLYEKRRARRRRRPTPARAPDSRAGRRSDRSSGRRRGRPRSAGRSRAPLPRRPRRRRGCRSPAPAPRRRGRRLAALDDHLGRSCSTNAATRNGRRSSAPAVRICTTRAPP